MRHIEVRVRGVVGRLAMMSLTDGNPLEAQTETALSTPYVDQAQLQALIRRVGDLGLDLVGVEVTDDER